MSGNVIIGERSCTGNKACMGSFGVTLISSEACTGTDSCNTITGAAPTLIGNDEVLFKAGNMSCLGTMSCIRSGTGTGDIEIPNESCQGVSSCGKNKKGINVGNKSCNSKRSCGSHNENITG